MPMHNASLAMRTSGVVVKGIAVPLQPARGAEGHWIPAGDACRLPKVIWRLGWAVGVSGVWSFERSRRAQRRHTPEPGMRCGSGDPLCAAEERRLRRETD